MARAAAATAADVVARWWSMYGEDGVGLRGGTFTAKGDTTVRFRLHAVKWVDDLSVNGTIIWQRDTGAIAAKLGPAGRRQPFPAHDELERLGAARPGHDHRHRRAAPASLDFPP